MNWNMIISGFIIVVIKVAGMTVFLLYCEYLCEPSPQRPYCQNVRLSIKVQCHVPPQCPSSLYQTQGLLLYSKDAQLTV